MLLLVSPKSASYSSLHFACKLVCTRKCSRARSNVRSVLSESGLLCAWSVRGNWRRLTATYQDGDPRLSALSPVQGIRSVHHFLPSS